MENKTCKKCDREMPDNTDDTICEYCKKKSKEKQNRFLKGMLSAGASVLAVTVFLKVKD
ncbi:MULTISPECIES: hypothetical protein [Carnobacterium]|uniref:hypothetical protein n=1 Tax=Carnobacterium TaxID=2747 RepID=UPI00030C9107|nr:hypothetical protein [Carnobacterium maltaromaticum]